MGKMHCGRMFLRKNMAHVGVLEGGVTSWSRFTSVWWKYVVKLDDFGSLGWFNGEILRKVRNGLKTNF